MRAGPVRRARISPSPSREVPPNMPPADRSDRVRKTRRPRALRLIALYKLVKAMACLLLAAAAFRLVQPAVADRLDDWLASLTWATQHGLIASLVDKLATFGPKQFRLVGAAALTYMGLYAVQGLGLWFGQRWAEWLVVIETGLLLPFEVWQLSKQVSMLKLLVFLGNVLIVLYLAYLLRKQAANTTV